MLTQLKHMILDMDGVLWRGDTAIGHLPDFFEILDRLGIRAVFATNNASKTPAQYIEKFSRMGVAITADQVMTSALATSQYLADNYTPSETKVYVIGRDGLIEGLKAQGFGILPRFEQETPADIVAVGFNMEVQYEDFASATLQIRNHGARLIGCNPDKSFPSERGLLPGNGSLLALVQTASGQDPTIIGKPFPHMYNALLGRLGPAATPENTLMVGDRLDTDIQGAQGVGLPAALVMSGVTRMADADVSPIRPEFRFQDIHQLGRALLEAAA